jgi:hypothetical protein
MEALCARLRHGSLADGDVDAFIAYLVAATGENGVAPVARRAIGGSTEAAFALWQSCGRPLPRSTPSSRKPALDLCARLLEVLKDSGPFGGSGSDQGHP